VLLLLLCQSYAYPAQCHYPQGIQGFAKRS
jgi:hypothetical protein